MNKVGSFSRKIAGWGLVVTIPLLITSAVIALAVNFQPLYEYGFNRYDVGATTGLADAELAKAARGLIDYFNSHEQFIDVTVEKDGQPFHLFNDREIAHLYDVKGLIRLDYRVLGANLVFTAIVLGVMLYRREPRRLAGPLFLGGALTLAIVAAGATMAIADFDAFFTRFHLLSFANDFWLLDPATDYLIRLFPGGFWRDAAIFVGGLIGIIAAAATFFGWRNLKREE